MEDMKEMYEMKEIYETTKIQKRKNKNKGFSLVELIIVIAIMAILVGVVGTQVLPYMEKSREAKDLQLVSAVCTAATTAFAENADSISADETIIYSATTETGKDKIREEIRTLVGVTDSSKKLFTEYFSGTLSSKSAKTANSIVIIYNYSKGTVSVRLNTLANGTGSGVLAEVTSK